MTSDPGVDEWKEQTTSEERVRAVARGMQSPRSVAWIASEAHVDEDTTQEVLAQLVEEGMLTEREGDGPTKYAADPLYARVETLQDLLAEHDETDLKRLKQELEKEAERNDDPHESSLIDYRLALVKDAIDLRHISDME
jgi:DNA-binding transcriptional regulator YhcF (GntR family)